MSKQIIGFKFVWAERTKNFSNFEEIAKDFVGKFKVKETGEVVEFNYNDMINEKTINLKQSINAVQRPFGENVNCAAYVYDRPLSSKHFYCVDVKLDEFLKTDSTVPTVCIGFMGPAFVVYSYDCSK